MSDVCKANKNLEVEELFVQNKLCSVKIATNSGKLQLIIHISLKMLQNMHESVTISHNLSSSKFWINFILLQNIIDFFFNPNRLKIQQEKLIKVCIEQFFLQRLYKEQSVSSEQMVESCKRLLEEPTELPRMHLCISHFYSVLQDGDLCIPWDWKQ